MNTNRHIACADSAVGLTPRPALFAWRSPRVRRGSAYLFVLSVAMIVFVVGVGSLAVVKGHAGAAATLNDSDEARQYALAGIEMGQLWINSDPNWRSNRPNGFWATNRAVGGGTFSLEVIDPADGVLDDDPGQSVLLRSTGMKNHARHVVEVVLDPVGPPLDVLQFAMHSAGQVRIRSGDHLRVRNAPIYTSGSLRNDGIISGNVNAGSVTTAGVILGTLTQDATPQLLPASDVAELYASIGTLIEPGNTIEKVVLSPGNNPWGQTNGQGVYVIRTTSDLTIKKCRINATLVIINPGKKVTIQDDVLIHPSSRERPTLIIVGDAVFKYKSSTPLSESAHGVNFNPPGSPYRGASDEDISDQYPSQIRGLVHVQGKVTIEDHGTLHGVLLSESNISSEAIKCDSDFEIVYDDSFLMSPPLGYTKPGKMAIVNGSWRQSVD